MGRVRQTSGCSSVAARAGAFGTVGGSSRSGIATFVEVLVGEEVSYLEVVSSAGIVRVPAVPLRPLGLPGRSFGHALPDGAAVTALVAFDSERNELERSVLRQ